MASSSSPRTWKYSVFTSFHGPDVRKTFLSHLRKQFEHNGIKMFDDQGIERSQIIPPALREAIRESRISIVVLSKNYASSSWCLNELLEILKCKEDAGQIVMTVFHGVDPSDVRKQIGDFGIAFKETCAYRTEEEKIKWSHALSYVGNIAGEDFKNWDNEAKMIEKIARDVSDKLNVTPSRDFEGMVGLEAHLRKVESLLNLDNDGVKIVGISGPTGIGKSTIARALHSRLSSNFPLSCFMDNLRGSYHCGFDVYGSKLHLQEQLLSKILNLNGMTIRHLGVIKDRLHDQKVFIILDDVEGLDQLETLANIMWFGPGSRIIVTTENKEILLQHGITDIYPVGFPSGSEALKIFCLSAFSHTSPPYGFMDLAYEVVKICGNLPFGLHVLGSSLRGKSKADWIDKLPGMKKCLDGRIESVLKVGYEILDEKDQELFLHIAVFFNYEHVDHVASMLEKSIFDVRHRLKTLANKYLIHIDGGPESRVVMQRYLQLMAIQQVMARQAISRQEPWKRHILVDAQQICYVLENAESNGSIVGVSFNVAEINELTISARAFERMSNLVFLKVYGWRTAQERRLRIPEEIKFPRRLRLLHWEAYPRKSLPLRFCPENLVELHMVGSKLEKLWEGTQPLATLKIMKLSRSSCLKELPDLSNATNLERLDLSFCTALVELPSAFANLHKLDYLLMDFCENIEVIPTLINLACLEEINIIGCLRLRSFPKFPTNITKLIITGTAVEELAASIRDCSCLEYVDVSGSGILKTLTHLPKSVTHLKLSNSGIEKITDCIKDLHNLQNLQLSCCKRLVSLPELPSSLEYLKVDDCESLERVSGPLNTPNAMFDFVNCFKLDREARRAVIQRSFVNKWAVLPGKEVPTGGYFNHRARGNSLTIPHSDFNRFKVCVVISLELDEATYQDDTNQDDDNVFEVSKLLCRCIDIDVPVIEYPGDLESEHLLIFDYSLPFIDPSEVSRKIVLQFRLQRNNKYHHHVFHTYIIECGIQILTDETDRSNNGESSNEDDNSDHWFTHESDEANSESGKAFEKEDDDEVEKKSDQGVEDDDDSVSLTDSDEASDKEDDEEGYESESGEASRDKDEDIGDD